LLFKAAGVSVSYSTSGGSDITALALSLNNLGNSITISVAVGALQA
jgi:hypothetical protein